MLTEDEVVRSIANEIQRCTILQEVASLAVAEMVGRAFWAELERQAVADVKRKHAAGMTVEQIAATWMNIDPAVIERVLKS